MDIFSNREISLFIWSSIGLIWAFSIKDVRHGIWNVLLISISKPFLTIYAFMLSYIALMLFGLHSLEIWDFGQTKTTVFWTLTVALISLYRANSIKNYPEFFKNSVKDSVGLVIFLEFLVSFYTFGLVAELFIVPILTLIGLLSAVAEFNEKHQSVHKFLNGVMSLIGISFLVNALYRIFIDISEFAHTSTLVDFYTPPLLSVSFLTFLYGLHVFMTYETALLRLSTKKIDKSLTKYAKRKAVLAFRLNLKLLERWASMVAIVGLSDREEVDKSISDLKELSAYEKNPKGIPIEEGWCPYTAKDYLAEYGLTTGYYKTVCEPEWFATSTTLNLGEEILSNYMFYEVTGDRYVAKKLVLKINVHQPDRFDEDIETFIEISEALLYCSLGGEFVSDLREVMAKESAAEGTVNDKKVSLRKEEWGAANSGQFSWTLTISKVMRGH